MLEQWEQHALMKIAEQKQKDNPDALLSECYMDCFTDYKQGFITIDYLDFIRKNPDAVIVLGYERDLH